MAVVLWSCVLGLPPATADDWMTWPSTYTHEPISGQRVDQYAVAQQPVAPQREDFVRSGYRHFRSTLQTGQSADNMHVVEQWGRPIVPYEQWRFPYRPYAVPYDAWGPQASYGIVNGNFGAAFPGNPWGGGGQLPPGSIPPGNFPPGNFPPGSVPPSYGQGNAGYAPSRGFPLTPPYNNEPWYDGTYPSAPPLDPRSDQEFFYRPRR